MRGTRFSGFLLIEVVLVVFFSSLLCLLVIPTLCRLQRKMVLLSAAHQVATVIRLARVEAIEGETQTRIIFDVAGNSVVFRGKENKSVRYKMPSGVFLYTTNFPSHELRFLPRGTPFCGGTVVLRTRSERKYIIVVPVTGRVRLSDTPPPPM
ncbi:MAG: hypothetical protein N2205_08460 [Candidatus Caldatribacterium sp.]|uniref:GspH/FimT family pseudopilin n=1 Tax=Candidatus Caldatribacterium sp. TaxID=2282143 RepID=UPI00299174EA|nr:hypothetical protein [Candidatus Caldatribacterium sp.]MCX7731228.1 hypothetical protein [Candidatus Caldatribacterium sp.]MDW8080797.1 hypothetical protein [Candidatus Calescibacterium sp.]